MKSRAGNNEAGYAAVGYNISVVGAMIPAKSLRIVLLPAPLWPTNPNVSPFFTLKETFLSAQKFLYCKEGLLRSFENISGRTPCSNVGRSPRRKLFDTLLNSTAYSAIVRYSLQINVHFYETKVTP